MAEASQSVHFFLPAASPHKSTPPVIVRSQRALHTAWLSDRQIFFFACLIRFHQEGMFFFNSRFDL